MPGSSEDLRHGGSLPTERDFDPYEGDLDAQWAWKHFGGLTLEAAASKFRENPLSYQEAFMFMGGKAFSFYFPIIEEYLRDTPIEYDGDSRESWILAHCIAYQFRANTASYVLPLAPRVMDLSRFVQQYIVRFGDDPAEQRRIAEAWLELENVIRAVTDA